MATVSPSMPDESGNVTTARAADQVLAQATVAQPTSCVKTSVGSSDSKSIEECQQNASSDTVGLELEITRVCGLELRMLRRRSDYFAACAGDLPILSTGLVLWECGLLLADYLGYACWIDSAGTAGNHPWWLTHPPAPVVPSRFWHKRKVLELGGGCGLIATVLACLGAHVVCTDGDPATLQTAARNICEAKNRYSRDWGEVKIRSLKWGKPDDAKALVEEFGGFDYVVGSDLLYGDKAPPEPLVETLAAIAETSGGRNAEVILAVKNRCADETGAFKKTAAERGMWEITLAPSDCFIEGYDGESTYGGGGPAYNIIHLARPSAKAGVAKGCSEGAGESSKEITSAEVDLPASKRLRAAEDLTA